MQEVDAAIVGSGPNGLAAAVTLARAGLRVELFEQHETIGGGLRSAPLFDSEITHDICSAVHPMAGASSFFREFDLESRGVDLLRPAIAYAHPLPEGRAALAHTDLEATCSALGTDGARYRRLMAPLVDHSHGVTDLILSGQRSVPDDLAAPLLLAPRALALATRSDPFLTAEAKALLTGVSAHVVGKLPSLTGAVVALLLGHLAHSSGWLIPRGGSGRIAEAMAADINANGGAIHTGARIKDLADLPSARCVLLDVAPKALLDIAGARLPPRYSAALARYRYGPGAAKVDFLVSEPIPWKVPDLGRAGTVHLGGTQSDMFRTETLTSRGARVDDPFVLLVEPAATDSSRARAGKWPVWAYAHVPHGDTQDPVDLVRRRIEAEAPGFSDTIIASRGIAAAEMEEYNPNYVGGDIAAGAMTLTQAVLRPTARVNPYRVPLKGIYLCSASTPPGPSVHGMSGHLAALSALRREFGIRTAPSLS